MARIRTHAANNPATTAKAAEKPSEKGSTDYGPDIKNARFVSMIDDKTIERIDAEKAEEVVAHNCPNLVEINAPAARLVLARGCPKLATVNAPAVTSTIDVRDSNPEVKVNAPNARKVLK